MLTFACQDIEFSELLRCSFELNKTEYNVFMFLLKQHKWWTASKIGKAMNFDRTTVQKAIKSLAEKDIVKRYQENLSKGGYTYLYNIKNKEDIKKRMEKIVSDWYKEVQKEIQHW